MLSETTFQGAITAASKTSWQKGAGQNSAVRLWSAYVRNRAIKLNLLN